VNFPTSFEEQDVTSMKYYREQNGVSVTCFVATLQHIVLQYTQRLAVRSSFQSSESSRVLEHLWMSQRYISRAPLAPFDEIDEY
jgi:hypothetical protein